jgi:Reverse transcriptase (RNA-dependent DNA polymerase)
LNNRLKLVVDRVTSRAQKGFTSSRYLQEVLINVTESIASCNVNHTSGAVITIDQAKAFDSLDHKYLEECYKFFNFGNNIIKMLNAVGNSRQACIILDNGNTTTFFPLKCGRPQGENLSPIQYNIGNQILLIKIELNPLIKSLVPHFIGPAPAFRLYQNSLDCNKVFLKESCRETNKAEGFADDATVLTLAEKDSVLAVQNTLSDFSLISGLKCNFNKSFITIVGPRINLDWITECCSVEANKFKLLGFEFSNTNLMADLDKNFDKCYDKINDTVRFWSRFGLSLPARISIAKTFMIQQVNHLGCIVMPSDST